MHTIRALFHLIIAIALLLFITGCSHAPEEVELNRAEAVIEQHPDSALAILQAIDGSALKGELRARHALLLSQALDKNYIDIADDSIIAPAYDYYTTHPEYREKLAKTYYYRGIVAYNALDYQGSIYYATLADTLSTRTHNIPLKGRAQSLLAYCYNGLLDFTKQHQHTKKAFDLFISCNDSTNASLMLRNLASSQIQLQMFDEAQASLNNPLCAPDYLLSAICQIELNNLDGYNVTITNHPEIEDDSHLTCRYAHKLIEHGNLTEAKNAISHAYRKAKTHEDSIACLIALSYLNLTQNNWQEYSSNASILLKERAQASEKIKSTYVPTSSIGAYSTLREMDQAESYRHELTVSIWLCLFIGISLTLIIIIIIQRHRIKDALKDHKLAIAHVGTEESSVIKTADICEEKKLLHADNTLESLEATINQRKESLRRLCSSFNKIPSSDNGLRESIENEMCSILDEQFKVILESYANLRFDDVMTKARAHGFKANDLLLIPLFYAHFTIEQIMVLTHMTYHTVTVRKSRIKKQLIELGISADFCRG